VASPWRFSSAVRWFAEQVCEAEADGVGCLLRKNQAEAAREQRRLEDRLARLCRKLERRNQKASRSKRCQPEPGLRQLQLWAASHKLGGQVELRAEGRTVKLERNPAAIDRAMQLAGCYAVVTDVPKKRMNGQAVHNSCLSLQKVERDFRPMKTGLLEVRPVFVRKESRTPGHVLCCLPALKLGCETERRLPAAFETTDANPHAVTVGDAMAALSRLCPLEYQIDDQTTPTRLPTPDPRQKEILTAFRISLPQK
jgi:hypothetical protein